MARDADIAWAAGLFEGEGNARVTRSGVAMALSMTDEDAVRRFGDIMGTGKVRFYEARPQRKTVWRWTVQDRNGVIAALSAIYPWLCSRRREQADAVLERAHEMRPRSGPRTYCNRGHKFSDPGVLYIHAKTGKRHCRVCRSNYVRSGPNG